MTIERTEVLWLEARSDYTLDEVIEMSGLPQSVVDDLVACGALPVTPADPNPSRGQVMQFESESILLARAAHRLLAHFELEQHGLAVAVSLLRRIRRLERQVAALSFTDL